MECRIYCPLTPSQPGGSGSGYGSEGGGPEPTPTTARISINGSDPFELPGPVEICIYEPGTYNPPMQYPERCEPSYWTVDGGNPNDGGTGGRRGGFDPSRYYRVYMDHESAGRVGLNWIMRDIQTVRRDFPPDTVFDDNGDLPGGYITFGLFFSGITPSGDYFEILYASPVRGFGTLVLFPLEGGLDDPYEPPNGPGYRPPDPPCMISPIQGSSRRPEPGKHYVEITTFGAIPFSIAFPSNGAPTIDVQCQGACHLPCKQDLKVKLDAVLGKVGRL